MPKIETMYAFIAEGEGPDDEGIIGIDTPIGWMPLVGGDMKRAESLKPIATSVAKQIGKQVKLVQFETRKEIGTIEP